ncbi:MAG: helix-turn-helix domain-containing protein [Nitrospiraceae bacterium]
MSVRSSVFSMLLLGADSDLQAQFKEIFTDATITAARDAAALSKEVARRSFDAVVVESKQGSMNELTALQPALDPSRTVIITGSRNALKRASKLMQGAGEKTPPHNGAGSRLSLEDYIESKMGDFVKGMRNGSARNLHPMLMTAVERPLIALALKETHGNQIQAAELLGLNRNTLRKKITDLHIPIKRGKPTGTRTA